MLEGSGNGQNAFFLPGPADNLHSNGQPFIRPVYWKNHRRIAEKVEPLRIARRIEVFHSSTVHGPRTFAVTERRNRIDRAKKYRIALHLAEKTSAQDIAPAFEALKTGADALYVCIDALTNANRIRINILATGARLPTMHGYRDYVEAGGLMSYGVSIPNQFRRSADYVDKILRGAKPGDIPVEQPTKFDLIVSLTAAQALGLSLSSTLLARADEVIE